MLLLHYWQRPVHGQVRWQVEAALPWLLPRLRSEALAVRAIVPAPWVKGLERRTN